MFINIMLLFSQLLTGSVHINEKSVVTVRTIKMEKIITIYTATFGCGCFWCVEAFYQQLNGVISVTSGYEGGKTKDPTYKEVCSGLTGHAEVCQIIYDPSVISFVELLEVFWSIHDPTTLNRQGNDFGTQYRSVIFYHNQQQNDFAEEYKKKLNGSGAFNKPIVTEISPNQVFYKAENYHQEYFDKNPNDAYCNFVLVPKLDKFKKVFKEKLKNKDR
jgi:peptide-methionine (S)-S-oxide reductase